MVDNFEYFKSTVLKILDITEDSFNELKQNKGGLLLEEYINTSFKSGKTPFQIAIDILENKL